MKNKEAAGLSGLISGMVKSPGKARIDKKADIINQIIVGLVLVEWELSSATVKEKDMFQEKETIVD